MLGDLYSSSVSNPGFNVNPHHEAAWNMLKVCQWICSPASTELEQVTIDWMAKLLGLSDCFLTCSKIGGGIILVGS